jgi:hypothetical protein
MGKQLVGNVYVDGAWYGPSYPNAQVTEDVLAQITNPAAFDAEAQGSHPDLRFRADDFAPGAVAEYTPPPAYPPDANVAEVLEWVGEDPSKAAQALDSERNRAKGQRSSLIEALEKITGA